MKFEMSSIEWSETCKWIKSHDKTCTLLKNNIHDTIGARITYTFTPTGLGMACGVRCACGESQETTDVSNW